MLLVMLPFMSNFVVRAYAVKFLIGVEGPINRLLMDFGLIHMPLFLESPRLAIWFGMVTNYLPFMVLPLFVAFERYDLALIEAARDLGASWLQVCSRVLWPMTKKPVLSGLVLVFVPAVGEFVIPDLMGGGKTMYLGNLMTEQFLRVRDWPFGAAVCISLMVVIGVTAAFIARVYRAGRRVAVSTSSVKCFGGVGWGCFTFLSSHSSCIHLLYQILVRHRLGGCLSMHIAI